MSLALTSEGNGTADPTECTGVGRYRPYLFIGALLVLTALIYAPSLRYPYVYEDHNDPKLFLRAWAGWQTEFHAFNWQHPARYLSNFSYRLSHRLSGGAPWGDHLANVSVHLVNTLLVALVAWPTLGPVVAMLASGLFALHPIQTESVAYAASRPDLLVGTGILIGLLGVSYRQSWLVLVGLVLAALSKETGVMAAPLCLWWSTRTDRPIAIYAALLMGLAAGLIVAGHSIEFHTVAFGSTAFISAQLAMVWRLLALVIWPVGFTIDHNWSWITPFLSMCAYVALGLTILWHGESKRDGVTFAILFTFVALLPRLIAVDPEHLHEHHLYGPMIGISLGLGQRLAEVCA